MDVSKREDSGVNHGVLVSNWVNAGKEKDHRYLLQFGCRVCDNTIY